MKSRLPLRVLLIAVVGCLAWAGWLGQQHVSGRVSPLDRLESAFLDLRVLASGQRLSPAKIAIVAIDGATVSAEGGYPIDRDRLALIVDGIRDAGATALAIDLLLLDSTETSSERLLAAAMGSFPVAIAGAGEFDSTETTRAFVPKTTTELYPLPIFRSVAKVGLVNISSDAGGTPRHMPLVFKTATGLMPSLGLQAVGLYLGAPARLTDEGVRIGNRLQPLDLGWHLPLRYYGPRGTIQTLSGQTFLDRSSARPNLDEYIVLLGATATGVGDRFSTPFDPVLPGVEVLATGVANLLDGSGLIRDMRIRRIDMGVALVLGLIGVITVANLPLVFASAVFFLSLIAWITGITALFAQGYWLSTSLPLAASLPPVLALVLVRLAFDRRQAKQQAVAREELGRFQSPQLAKRISEDPLFLAAPTEQESAILFVDLAGFTGVSERLGPLKTREMLKGFHTLIVDEAERHHGLVLDFMGDGAMIGFGITNPGPDNARNALGAAFSLAAATRRWIEHSGLQNDIHAFRIGGHCGQIVLSRLGHDTQQQIAVTGDCVNVASRLMDIGNDRDTMIVVSTRLLDEARAYGLDVPKQDVTDTVAIRGRKDTMSVAMWRAATIYEY